MGTLTQDSWRTSFAELTRARLAHYHPFRAGSDVVCLKAILPSGAPVFVKYFTGGNGARKASNEFTALLKYHNAMPRELGFSCPTPLDCWLDTNWGGAYVLEWINDRRGDSYFKTYMPFEFIRKDGIRRSAEWISLFHSIGGLRSVPVRNVLDVESSFDEVERTILGDRKLLAAHPLNSKLSEFRQRLMNLGSQTVTTTLIHGDFTPANIFITKTGVIGFDFTATSIRPAAVDIASFLAPLLWYGSSRILKSKGDQFRADLDLFLKHYARHSSVDTFEVIMLFCLVELMRRGHTLKQQAASATYWKRWSRLNHMRMIRKIVLHEVSRSR